MPTRQSIVNTLMTDLNANFTVANGFTKVHEIRFGVFDPSELPSLPSIGLWLMKDSVMDDLMDDDVYRKADFVIYGYADADMVSQYETFYTLISDCEKFLYSPSYNSIYKNVLLGNVEITYGGASDYIGLFTVEFSILYSQTGLES
jgi:hypothetical protein